MENNEFTKYLLNIRNFLQRDKSNENWQDLILEFFTLLKLSKIRLNSIHSEIIFKGLLDKDLDLSNPLEDIKVGSLRNTILEKSVVYNFAFERIKSELKKTKMYEKRK